MLTVVASFVAIVSTSLAAWGQELPVVGSANGCPEPAAVRAEVSRLVSSEQQRALPPEAGVQLQDDGDHFSVMVRAPERTVRRRFADAGRDCPRRARIAAVFATLTLFPPDIGELLSGADGVAGEAGAPAVPKGGPPVAAPSAVPTSQRPPAAPPQSTPAQPPPASAARLVRPTPPREARSGQRSHPKGLQISVRMRLEAAPPLRSRVAGHAWAVDVMGAWGLGQWKWIAGVGYSPQARLAGATSTLHVERFPAILGLRWDRALGGARVMLELAGSGILERYKGLGLVHPASGVALELATQVGAFVGWPAEGRWSGFAGIQASLIPFPLSIEMLPAGSPDRMPSAWLGAVLGAALDL